MKGRRERIPHYDDPVEVGRRLHSAREAAGLSQRELAFPGCSAAYISRIERGERVPSLQVMRELARRVGISEPQLARGRELVDPEVATRLSVLEEAHRGGDREQIARAYRGLARAASKAARTAA